MQAQKTAENTLLAPVGPDPGPDDLAAIRRFTLTDIPADRLYVRRVALANDAVDRQYEQIPRPVLQRLADTLPGKSLLISHNKKQLGQGLWHTAEVRRSVPGEAGAWTLEARFYLLKSPENQELRDKIDAGVIRHTSISFGPNTRTCDICGGDADTCPHMPGEMSAGQPTTFTFSADPSLYETLEASLTYLGAQKGSHIVKSAQKEPSVEELEKAKARISELQKELEAAKDAHQNRTEAEKSLDEANTAAQKAQDELEATKAQVEALKSDTATKALVADGQAYRALLQSEVKRLAGILHREKQIEPILHLTAAAGTEALKSLHDGLLSEVEEKFPNQPLGQSMATDKSADERTSPSPGTPFSLL
jgi:hypothetical protein